MHNTATAHFKCIIKIEVVISLSFRENKETKCIPFKFHTILKGPLFPYQKYAD